MKKKREASPIRNKPNPILHMMTWGIGSGTILLMLFILFFVIRERFDITQKLIMIIPAWVVSQPFGALPGFILGLLTGIVLHILGKGFREPFDYAEMQAQRYRVYVFTSIISSISIYLFTLLGLWFFGKQMTLWMPHHFFELASLILLPFIVVVVSVYAAHRYMFRLRLWSEQQYGVQKEKDKHFERLEDKRSYGELADENEAESRESKTS